MKRKCVYSILLIILLLINQGCIFNKPSKEEIIKYINYLVKKIEREDFFVAHIEEGELIFENKKFDIIKKIKINYTEKKIKIISIYKEDNIIYFIRGGAVDDNYGILYSKQEITRVFGVKYLEKMSDELYYYSTWEK